MKVEKQNIGGCRWNLIINADPKECEADYKKVLKTFNDAGRISGFRKGKAPIEIIKKNFQREIIQETEKRLFRTIYQKAVDEENLKVVAALEVKDVIFSPETGIVFTAVVDLEPKFSLPKYRKIPIDPREVAVTEEELDHYMERMRAAFAKFEETSAEYEIQKNDLVCMDFAGSVGGQPLKEIDPAAEAISSKSDFWVQVDESQFLPEVINAAVGLTSGAETAVEFKLPKAMPMEALRGKKVRYELKIKAVRKRVVPADAELCAQLKVESLEEFRQDARSKMAEVANQEEQYRRKQAVTEYLLNKATFEVPESEMKEAVNNILEQMKREAQQRGVKSEELAAQRDEILQSATASATNQVRFKYIIREIARAEGIEASDEEVDEKIQSMTSEYKMDAEELRKRLFEGGHQDVLKEQVVFDKTMELLIAEGK
ncbi:MAG: trigger factor [Kiritimatiellae bacterium]|nr:trigger factor [Kiritimatiellia bacterium]